MAAKIFRINYKSDFILTMNSEAGWTIPFCIKFWTSIPMRAYYVGFDGTTYTHCAYDPAEPTKLLVQFDDHHLPIGNLHFQIAYHFTVEDFPNNTEDEVFNATPITTEIDGETYQVMLDFTGETAPGIDFNMPSVGVTSVNGKIGAVTLNAEDVGAQPTIEDLATIRSGAAAGATAVQPAAFQQGLATKQDTIADLSTIRSGAAAGATAVQPAGLTPIESALQTIEAVIPSAASSQNQLADKNFVNSSISTNTANFVGTYNSLAELQAVQNPTNNDYGFVIETDAQGNEYYDRYKYVAASQQWLFEYKVESTPFTAEQWAAIQSGITSALVTKLNALPTAQQLSNQLAAKQDTISDLATIRSGAAAGAEAAVRPYNTQSPDGMGYLVLDKDATFASQVTTANTIYEIRYDYDLNDRTVTMPDGCVLNFNGGSLSNGAITGSNTGINAGLVKIFDTDVTIAGSWNVVEAYPEWFGAKGDGLADDRLSIQLALDSPFRTIALYQDYRIASYSDAEGLVGLIIPARKIIIGKGVINYEQFHKIFAEPSLEFNILIALNGTAISMSNLCIYGDSQTNSLGTNTKIIIGSNNIWTSNIRMDNIYVRGSSEYGFKLFTFVSMFSHCSAAFTKVGFYIGGSSSLGRGTSTIITSCYAIDCISCAYSISYLSYSALISCAADRCSLGTLTNDDYSISYVYDIYDSKNISVISCGCENGGYGVKIDNSDRVKLDSCGFLNRNTSDIVPSKHLKFIFSQWVEITACNICSGVSDGIPLVSYDELSNHIFFSNCSYINVSQYRRTFDESNINNYPLSPIILENRVKTQIVSSAGYSGTMLDLNGKKLLNVASVVITHSDTINSPKVIERVDGEYIISSDYPENATYLRLNCNYAIQVIGCKKIIFRSICFNSPTASLNDYVLFKFQDSDVVFEDCRFEFTSSANMAHAFDMNNSSVVLINCEQYNPASSEWKYANVTDHSVKRIIDGAEYYNVSGEWVHPNGTKVKDIDYYNGSLERFAGSGTHFLQYAKEKVICADLDLNNTTLYLPANGIIRFDNGNIQNGTINLQKTMLLPMGLDISKNTNVTFKGFANGQVVFDSSLGKMKLWNGTAWVNMDGTALS